MYNYLPHTEEIRKEMLESIGLSSVDDLFKNIDPKVRVKGKLNLPEGLDELETKKKTY